MADSGPELAGSKTGAIWGRHPVKEALEAGYQLSLVMVARGSARSTEALRTLAGASNVPVAFVDASQLDGPSFAGNHQGVVAILKDAPAPRVDDLLKPRSGRVGPPFLLAADQVEDVGNLGSLIRTLETFGGTGVIVPARRSAALAGGLARASAGASLRVAIASVSNLVRTLATLKANGVQVVGLEVDGEIPFDALTYDTSCCLVVGSESRGMRDTVRKACDVVVRVPMRGSIGSLNVSSAGAIVLHYMGRERLEANP